MMQIEQYRPMHYHWVPLDLTLYIEHEHERQNTISNLWKMW